jgi:hypothetical protein
MILYHASDAEVSKPEIRKSVYTKDFGAGFYCTANYAQAERWARRDRNVASIINYYSYAINSGLRIKQFSEMSDEWLDFIADCRGGKEHNYDIVEGPMANDTVWNYINDFVSGIISREAFWALAKFKYPTHQICFCTSDALKCISFLKSEMIEKE